MIIYGGSFNPITTAHLEVAELAKKFSNQVVMLCPTKDHAFNKKLEPMSVRNRLISKSIRDIDRLTLDPLGTPKYMYEYARKFQNPILLVGSDIVNEIPRWYEYKKLIDLCHFYIVTRNNFLPDLTILKKYDIIGNIDSDISSTSVRFMAYYGVDVKDYVPEAVVEDIQKIYWRK